MRIRTIKPEFWRSDDITALSREDRLLFVGLWSYVDDNGVGIDDYRTIAADLFALEDDQKDVREFVREGLATFSRALLIARYEVDGKRYLHIRTWKKHQRVDRPNKVRYPEPPADYRPPTRGNGNDSRGARDTLATVSPSGTEEQGNRGTGEKDSSSEIADAITDDGTTIRDDIEQLCSRLLERVTENDFKTPTGLTAWRRQARLLLDRDKRDLTQALRLIDWATSHHFWHRNIRSMDKFRSQYDALLAQARAEQHGNQGRAAKPTITTRAVSSVDAAFDEWEARQAHRPANNVRALAHREGA